MNEDRASFSFKVALDLIRILASRAASMTETSFRDSLFRIRLPGESRLHIDAHCPGFYLEWGSFTIKLGSISPAVNYSNVDASFLAAVINQPLI